MKQNKKDILKKIKSTNAGFSIPENYFDEFEKDLHVYEKKIKSGFTSPEDYFDQVEKSILSKSNEENRITGFKTPDNYFKNIDRRIIKNISKSKPDRIINFNRNKYIKIISYSIAASLLLFFSLRSLNSNNDVIDFGTIEISEIESWLDEDLISFSSYDISETFNDVYLSGEANYSEDEILDYLDGEDIGDLIIDN